jgi:glyoxylase-like metal-dependent hydrolase (beta-lactamase superfamily II)
MTIDTFTGGIFETNCFFLPESGILVDAPQECADWLETAGHKPHLLLLTHGHIDHTWDAAKILRDHPGCRIVCHPETVPLITERDFFLKLGLNWEVDPVSAEDLDLIEEADSATYGGIDFKVLYVPGHCPGSLCFHHKAWAAVFAGDALFAGSIGRTDLPGGDHELLLHGIQEKLYTLGDNVRVLPGHGPATTIGQERRTNPFVRG